MSSATRLTFTLESNFAFLPYGDRRYGATDYHGFPVRVSIPAAPGRFQRDDRVEIRDREGKVVPSVTRPFVFWPDGSVRVWEVWLPANLKREQTLGFELVAAPPEAPAPSPGQPLLQPTRVTISAVLGDGSAVQTTVEFSPTPRNAATSPVLESEQAFEINHPTLGIAFRGALIRKSWGWYPGVELAVRVINYTAGAPANELKVKSLMLEFDLPGCGNSSYSIRHATFAAELMPRLYTSDKPFDVRIEGGAYVADIRQLGREQTDYALYERGPYAASVETWSATHDDESTWLVALPDATVRSPKGFTIRDRHVRIDLHPEWAAPLNWIRGMALYQRVALAQLPKATTPEQCENVALAWLRPPLVAVNPDAYRAAGWRIPFRYEPARYPATELAIRHTWAFSWTTGTFEWGDQVGANKGTLPLPPGVGIEKGCARNLEYDFVACAAKEYARTGLPDRWKQCRASAEHMMHTDFVAVSDDPWKEGGIPHHCNRHTTGSAYPSHIWIEGLTLYYQLSGDAYALHVARRVGDFFLKYLEKRWMVVEATAREVGWALVALGAIYDLTREDRYLRGIQQCVDFCLSKKVEELFPTDATFTIGVLCIGLDRVRPFYREQEVKACIIGVIEHITAHRRDGIGIYEYNFDSEYRAFEYVQTHLPEALHIAYRLSGDVKYLKAAWRLFQIHRAETPLTVQNKYQTDCGYAAGYHITWTMGPLAAFAERGWLDKVQFDEPE